MQRLNPKQVEWLVVNQPEIQNFTYEQDWNEPEDDYDERSMFEHHDIWLCQTCTVDYFLTPETYNSLPETFKQLADATK